MLADHNAPDALLLDGKQVLCPRIEIPGLERPWSIAAANILESELALMAGLRHVFTVKHGGLLDIGANFGQTLIRCLSIDSDRLWIGIEPNAVCCSYLMRLLQLNGFDRKFIVPLAASNRTEIVQLNVRSGSLMGTSSMVHGFRPDDFYSATFCAPALTGDEIITHWHASHSLCAIKIDVEGAEWHVLEGLRKTIVKHQPHLFFEVLPNYLVSTAQDLPTDNIQIRKANLERLDALLKEMSYKVYLLEEGGRIVHQATVLAPDRRDLSASTFCAIPFSESLPLSFS